MDYPTPSSLNVTSVMRSNRRVDTRPEIELRRQLHSLGLRFRKNYPIRLRGTLRHLDIAFPRQRLAVLVDGCFWHGCPIHGTIPKKNERYWAEKRERNIARDKEVDEALREADWVVMRIWEHMPVDEAAAVVSEAMVRLKPWALSIK